jgi:predicted TIM-barrel fold metal-dependent hydrolase
MALGDALVIDAVAHALDHSHESRDRNRYARSVVDGNFRWQNALIPDPYRLGPERYYTSISPEVLCSALFEESDTDVACFHQLPMRGIFKDFSPIEVGLEIRRQYPHRMFLYGAASPIDGSAMLEEVERQVEELGVIGIKLYPVDLVDGRLVSYSMADERLVYPLLEKCRELGVRVVAVHKAVPLGIAPVDPFRLGDVDVAAADFPDLTFEVVHSGYAFLDEASMQLSRFENVCINLEVTAQLLPKHPRKFATIIGELLLAGGSERIFWGSGCSFTHAQPLLERFAEFEMPRELVEEYGYPELTAQDKANILGLSFARVHGLDLDAIRDAIAGDDIEQRKRERGLREPWAELPQVAAA